MSTKVKLKGVRFSYAHVFKATAMEQGQQEKFSVAILIPKTNLEAKKAVDEAVKEAAELGKSTKFGGKIPPMLKGGLRDGDVERPDDEVYAGHWFIGANSNTKPGIVDKHLKKIVEDPAQSEFDDTISPEEFYSGCYGNVTVNFYAFNASGNKGVACGLNNIQKISDGDKLSGGASSAESDFDVEDDLL